MDIYFLKKDEFLNNVGLKTLENFSDEKKYNSEDKYLEHLCGLFLVKFVAKNVYKLQNLDIEICDKKPYFKSREKFFSISHSKNTIMVLFGDTNVGIDIEYVQSRDYKKVLKRYNADFEKATLEDFYKFWTNYESKIKLNEKEKSAFNFKFEDDYIVSCLSVKNDDKIEIIKELKSKSDKYILGQDFNLQDNIELIECNNIFEI